MTWLTGSEPASQALIVSLDEHQEIVEVMSYAASQLSDGFHFLGMAELIFQPFMLGDVVEHALHQERTTIHLMQHDGFVPEPQNPSVTSKHAVLGLKQLLGFLKTPLCGQGYFAVVLMYAVHPAHGVREPLCG